MAPRTVVELVDSAAQERPDSPLLLEPTGAALTIGEVSHLSIAAARWLAAHGVDKSMTVAWQLPSHCAAAVLMLALSRSVPVQVPVLHLFRQRVIGVTAHQCWQIERDTQARAARREQRLVPRVGLLRRPVPRKLPHRPELAAIAGGMDAPRIRKRTRVGDVACVIEALDVVARIEPLDRSAGNSRERSSALDRCRRRRVRGGRLHASFIIAPGHQSRITDRTAGVVGTSTPRSRRTTPKI